VRFVCADKPPEASRKLRYSASVPPLVRTIVDSVFTIIFLLEDLPGRCAWYYKAGWREAKLELDRLTGEYGHLSEWSAWLSQYSSWVDAGRETFQITADEAAYPSTIPPWPNPGKMPNYGIGRGPLPPTRQFLCYLNDWFYRDLSQQSHLSAHGLMKRGGFLLLPESQGNDTERRLAKFRSDQAFTTIILLLALTSEIEAGIRFGLDHRFKYVWGILVGYSEVAKELYERRYSSLL